MKKVISANLKVKSTESLLVMENEVKTPYSGARISYFDIHCSTYLVIG